MTKRKGQYSRWTKLAALAELERSGHSYYQTEKKTGIPRATLRRWELEQERGDLPLVTSALPPPVDDADLDDRFERLADQLVAALPEKLDEANLHQIIEALKLVLDKAGQAGGDRSTDAREKLIRNPGSLCRSGRDTARY